MTDTELFFFLLQSHTKRHACVGVVDVNLALVFLKEEIVELRLSTNEVITPVVGYA